jgi:hypothetical protein
MFSRMMLYSICSLLQIERLPMKKILLSAVFSALICSSCIGKTTPIITSLPSRVSSNSIATIAQPVVAAPRVVVIENVTFSLPNGAAWHDLALPNDMIKAMLRNNDTKSLILLGKADFPFDAHVFSMLVLKGTKEVGATIVSVKDVIINGKQMVAISSHKDGVAVTAWLAVEEGTAYNLSCGGPLGNTVVVNTCKNIADSFKIQ